MTGFFGGLAFGFGGNVIAPSGGGGGSLPTVLFSSASHDKSPYQDISGGGLTITTNAGASRGVVRTDHHSSTAKWQLEIIIPDTTTTIWLAIEDGTHDFGSADGLIPGSGAGGVVMSCHQDGGGFLFLEKDTSFINEYAYTQAPGDHLGVRVDEGAHTIQYYTTHSGVVTLQGPAQSWTSGSGLYYPSVGLPGTVGASTTLVPGASQVATLPSGYTYFGA